MKITVYTTSDCQFSKQEKEYLNSHALPFEEKNLETNREFLTEMLAVSNNFSGTPVTKIEKDDGQITVLKGFTKEEFDTALGLGLAEAHAAVSPPPPPSQPSQPQQPTPQEPTPQEPPPEPAKPPESLPPLDIPPSPPPQSSPQEVPPSSQPQAQTHSDDALNALLQQLNQPQQEAPTSSSQPVSPPQQPSASSTPSPSQNEDPALNALLKDLQSKSSA